MRWIALVAALAAVPATAADLNVVALFAGKAVVIIDGQRRLLAVGATSPEGVRLLQADSESALFEVDGRQRRIGLGGQISSHYVAAARREVRVWPDADGMYRIDGRLNGRPLRFMVDTGATVLTLNGEQARRLGIDYTAGQQGTVETASGREAAYGVTVDSVTLGDIRLARVRAVVLEGRFPSEALLGQSVLEQLEIRRDAGAMVFSARW